MICCRKFVLAFRMGLMKLDLDGEGDARLEVGPLKDGGSMYADYCPFCGTRMDLGYQVPQEPYVPEKDRSVLDVRKAQDFNNTVTCDPGPDVHTTV